MRDADANNTHFSYILNRHTTRQAAAAGYPPSVVSSQQKHSAATITTTTVLIHHMAAATVVAAAEEEHVTQNHQLHPHHSNPNPNSDSKTRRRKRRETTISLSATSSAISSSPPTNSMEPYSSSSSSPCSSSPMGPTTATYYPNSSYTRFNSALNAGLLNPMSPPPPLDKTTRSSPTLFDMMANEQDYQPRQQQQQQQQQQTLIPNPNPNPPPIQDRQLILQDRIAEIIGSCSPGNQFNRADSADVRLTLSSKDGLSISLNVHRQILVAHSRFFAAKLSDRWSKQQRSLPHLVEISDCDDVDIYVETLRLMYCKDLRRRLMKEDVSKVLGILKVSAAIVFDAGVLSCLEYLEAAPWAEDEEEKVASLLSQLHLESSGAGEVLKRVSLEAAHSATADEANGNGFSGEEILVRLLQVVLEGKDEKARREMKGLVSKMLRENNSASGGSNGRGDLSKGSLYSACNGCLQLLHYNFLRAAAADLAEVSQISRQADNLHWILDILIDRQIAEEFLRTWAAQSELSKLHSHVPVIHRYEVSRVTARLFVGIGKGQIMVSKEARSLLLRTWLEPFYEDFGWMRRACKGLDRHLVEDGLGNTILTLPLAMQQDILLAWFDRFLNSGDDCPNIQRGFEVWWRRAFWRRNGETERLPQLRIAAVCENSCG